MTIALFHKQYSKEHLEGVMAKMEQMGAPTIRAIWSELYGVWLAVEGCHRIRAAKALGLEVDIDDVSEEETICIQENGEMVERNVSELLEELTDNAPQTELINF